MNLIEIAPSIISADFSCLDRELKRLEEAGADALHVDVMDGNFVPNLTLGPSILCAIKRHTSLFLDVHLMVYHPYDYVQRFVESGAQSITFHLEATEDVEETMQFIKTCNCQVGLALNPDTSLSLVENYLPHLDRLLIMSVQPGFSGQDFLPEVCEKIKEAKQRIQELQAQGLCQNIQLQVDGGLNASTAPLVKKAGASSLVSGSYLLQHPDIKTAIAELKAL